MPYKVFVSHTNKPEDMAFINQILQRSALIGLQCYLAEHNASLGTDLREKLSNEIRTSDCMLLFVTKSSTNSDWVKWEVGIADGARKLVVPIIETGVAAPPFLAGKEYIAFSPHNSKATSESVVAYLHKLKIAKDQAQAVGWLVLGCLGFLALAAKD